MQPEPRQGLQPGNVIESVPITAMFLSRLSYTDSPSVGLRVVQDRPGSGMGCAHDCFFAE
jgi:hypothetical protein